MKSMLFVLATAVVCTMNPVKADEACCVKTVSIQARIREVDLNVVLKQYEEVQTELMKMRVQMALLDIDENRSDSERKQMMKNFEQRRQALRILREQFLGEMEKLAEVEVATK